MTSIQRDSDFKHALEQLGIEQQRVVGCQFVEDVLLLNGDSRVQQAIKVAKQKEASSPELENASAMAKRASLDSHARCGSDGDWQSQAAYFVAKAASVLISPQQSQRNPAWQAAVSCRMSSTCNNLANSIDDQNTEAEHQYQILERYLDEIAKSGETV